MKLTDSNWTNETNRANQSNLSNWIISFGVKRAGSENTFKKSMHGETSTFLCGIRAARSSKIIPKVQHEHWCWGMLLSVYKPFRMDGSWALWPQWNLLSMRRPYAFCPQGQKLRALQARVPIRVLHALRRWLHVPTRLQPRFEGWISIELGLLSYSLT